MELRQKLILASGSPRRLDLLKQVGIEPVRLMPMDLDETPKKSEHPRSLARRLSTDKARAAYGEIRRDPGVERQLYRCRRHGRRRRPPHPAQGGISGRGLLGSASPVGPQPLGVHRRLSDHAGGTVRQKIVETKVRFKRLSGLDIESYLASGQWRGKAGGYAVQGIAGCFVQKLVGSYTNVVGLPLFETLQLLSGEGFTVQSGWTEG